MSKRLKTVWQDMLSLGQIGKTKKMRIKAKNRNQRQNPDEKGE